MRIPPIYDLTQATGPTKTARLTRYDAARALPGSREGRVDWLRCVADDKRIAVVHRLALVRLGLHRHTDGRCDAVAAEIGIDRTAVLRALDVGARFGWLTNFPAR